MDRLIELNNANTGRLAGANRRRYRQLARGALKAMAAARDLVLKRAQGGGWRILTPTAIVDRFKRWPERAVTVRSPCFDRAVCHGRVATGNWPPLAPTAPDLPDSDILLLEPWIRCAPVDSTDDTWRGQSVVLG